MRRTVLAAAAAGVGGLSVWRLTGDSGKPGAAAAARFAASGLSAPEAGRVVLDPAQFPRAFHDPPMLAGAVRSGRLPPAAERIGLDPLVIAPLEGIGRYGGALRRAFIGPGDQQNAARFAAGPDGFLYWDADWKTLQPNIARGYEMSPDGKMLTLFLRRGMRWSDGAPFTADDVVFWYEDMYRHPKIVSRPSASLQVDGQDVVIRKLDEATLEFVSPAPHPTLPELFASYTDIAGLSLTGRQGLGGFAPRHYLSRFHPKYASEAALERDAKAEGFANWAIRLKQRNDWLLNAELPVVSPWRITSPINRADFELERNPYAIWVDTAGNQLPYIDRIVHAYCATPAVVNFKAAAGKLDFQDRHLHVSRLPFLLNNRRRSDYDVFLDPAAGADVGLRLNIGYDKDPELGDLLRSVEFRRALSMGIDREAINETLMLGTGRPSSAVPAPDSRYYPGPAWAQRWARLDVAEANRLLDGVGLTRRDDRGYRLRRDGEGRLRLSCQVFVSHFDYGAVAEMIREQWLALGLELEVKILEGTLWIQRSMAGEIPMAIQLCGTEDPFTYPELLFPYSSDQTGGFMGQDYAKWFRSNGRSGKRPPPEIEAMMALWRRGRRAGEAERVRVGQELIRRHVDHVLSIGIISGGLSMYGVHLAKAGLGNVPRRVLNTQVLRSPANALPMTFFFRG